MSLQTDTNYPIDLMDTLTLAVEAMYQLTLLPWEGVLRQDYHVAAGQLGEEIFFQPTAAAHADEQLEGQHMVYGLYAGCLSLSSRSLNLAYKTIVKMELRGQQLGLIYIQKRSTLALKTTMLNQVSRKILSYGGNSTFSDIATLHSSSLKDNADTGTISDPDDLDFKIRYQFTGRPQARDPGDIFLAALDALANAAPYDSYQRVLKLTGTDTRSTRNALIVVEAPNRPDRRRRPLTYGYAAKGVQLIIQMMRILKKFQIIQFELWYSGVKFGEGFVTRPRHDFEDTTERAGIA